MDVFDMKKSDFKNIPKLDALQEIKECDSVVIIPSFKGSSL